MYTVDGKKYNQRHLSSVMVNKLTTINDFQKTNSQVKIKWRRFDEISFCCDDDFWAFDITTVKKND